MVGIIPHRTLHYVPFAALSDGRNYFGDEHTLFYLPSASVLRFIQEERQPAGAQMLAMAQGQAEGLPVLNYVDEEANAVASLYHTEALTTGRASKTEFLKRAEQSSIIHIAAHAELNTVSPLFYRIRLADDKDNTGSLEVREIYNLNLTRTALVVLSACRTELGAHSQGDNIVGLNRAFIYAGTPTVIASLWAVNDKPTSVLMRAFYKHLQQGMGKAEALRAAQRETRATYPHPYYWAAFVLTGNPGPLSRGSANKH
jgi:CHAT domain-containing protein